VFWKRGDVTSAAMMLGASHARARAGAVVQVNEARLVAQARGPLEAALGSGDFARLQAKGAALDDAAIVATISAALDR
jgi:hypothetical protein